MILVPPWHHIVFTPPRHGWPSTSNPTLPLSLRCLHLPRLLLVPCSIQIEFQTHLSLSSPNSLVPNALPLHASTPHPPCVARACHAHILFSTGPDLHPLASWHLVRVAALVALKISVDFRQIINRRYQLLKSIWKAFSTSCPLAKRSMLPSS